MANGTIAFDTLQTSGQIDGTARSIDTDYLLNGSAKVWHQSSNAAVPADSFNVSGGTDNGTGDYSYAFSNSIANTNYSTPHIPAADTSAFMNNISRATGTMRVTGINHANSGTDMANSGTVFGDLA